MLDLQREQLAHDERFHREIARLSTAARLKHMALHFCKYTGQFATVLLNPEATALRVRTITDSFIISLCSANSLNFDLSKHLAPQVGEAATFRDLGLHLASQLYPSATLNDSWLMTAHAIHSAEMARACEKIDHLEAFPFREEIQNAVLKLCQIAIIAAYAASLDLVAAIQERRREVRDRNPLNSIL